MDDAVRSYLARYGEAEARAVEAPRGQYDNAIVIPCYDEDPESLDDVLGLVEGSPLAIVVVNAPEDAPPAPCLLYTSPSPRDGLLSRMPSSA